MRTALRLFLACFAVVVGSLASTHAEYRLVLEVPVYGQDTNSYCGAAVSQMMMMGYPDPLTQACFGQERVWETIQEYKQDSGFYTDPDGLRDTLMELNPPTAPGRYTIFNDPDREVVMHDILYWMAKRSYPTAALTELGDHWVVITGFETDIDPRLGDAELQCIYINDPEPADVGDSDDPCTTAIEGVEGGMSRYMTGAAWYETDWRGANIYGAKWEGDWVAVVDPPEREGRVTAPGELLRGAMIPPANALVLALAYAAAPPCHPGVALAFLRSARPEKVYLVNQGNRPYYIAPLVEGTKPGHPGAILMNPFDGAFREVGRFKRNLPFLKPEEAIDIAECSFRGTTRQASTAELVYKFSHQTQSPYRPLWKVTLHLMGSGTTIRYVDHFGQVFLEMTSPSLGGD